MLKSSLLPIALFAILFTGNAQDSKSVTHSLKKNHVSVLFGLNQPLVLHGFNFEVDYWTRKWVFDYSHGFGLDVTGKSLGKEYEDQKLDFKISHSFGFGVGYRFTDAFNIRFEPKIHRYETYYSPIGKGSQPSVANFTTYTLGLGAYYQILPFAKSEGFLKGISVVPSVRYWQKVGSSLGKDGLNYFNERTNKTETLKAPNIGISNSPFLFNISIGYTF